MNHELIQKERIKGKIEGKKRTRGKRATVSQIQKRKKRWTQMLIF